MKVECTESRVGSELVGSRHVLVLLELLAQREHLATKSGYEQIRGGLEGRAPQLVHLLRPAHNGHRVLVQTLLQRSINTRV